MESDKTESPNADGQVPVLSVPKAQKRNRKRSRTRKPLPQEKVETIPQTPRRADTPYRRPQSRENRTSYSPAPAMAYQLAETQKTLSIMTSKITMQMEELNKKHLELLDEKNKVKQEALREREQKIKLLEKDLEAKVKETEAQRKEAEAAKLEKIAEKLEAVEEELRVKDKKILSLTLKQLGIHDDDPDAGKLEVYLEQVKTHSETGSNESEKVEEENEGEDEEESIIKTFAVPKNKFNEVQAFFDKIGWRGVKLLEGSLNPHWKGAALRECATEMAFNYFDHQKEIISLYGSARDAKYCKRIMIMMDKTGYYDAKDLLRYKTCLEHGVAVTEVNPEYCLGKQILLMNVYRIGASDLKSYIEGALCYGSTVLWAGYLYPDDARAGISHDEAVWFIDEYQGKRYVEHHADNNNVYTHEVVNNILSLKPQLVACWENFYLLRFSQNMHASNISICNTVTRVRCEPVPRSIDAPFGLGSVVLPSWFSCKVDVLVNCLPTRNIHSQVNQLNISMLRSNLLLDADVVALRHFRPEWIDSMITPSALYACTRIQQSHQPISLNWLSSTQLVRQIDKKINSFQELPCFNMSNFKTVAGIGLGAFIGISLWYSCMRRSNVCAVDIDTEKLTSQVNTVIKYSAITIWIPLFEELFKDACAKITGLPRPVVGCAFGLYELATKWGMVNPMLHPSFHTAISVVPPLWSLALHVSWNSAVVLAASSENEVLTSCLTTYALVIPVLVMGYKYWKKYECQTTDTYFTAYKRHYYVEAQDDIIVPDYFDYFSYTESFVSRVSSRKALEYVQDSRIDVNVDDFLCDYSDKFFVDPQQSIQVLLCYGVPIYAPVNSDYNLLQAVKRRITQEPAYCLSKQHEFFASLPFLFNKVIEVEYTEELVVNWIESIGEARKKRKAIRSFNLIQQMGFCIREVRYIEGGLKMDEKFLVPFVPRIISRVDNKVAVFTCPVYAEAMHHLTRYCKEHYLRLGDFEFIGEIACGYTGDMLDIWFKRSHAVEKDSITVSGDDVVAIIMGKNGKRLYVEIDAKNFDLNQGPAVQDYMNEAAKRAGIPEEQADAIRYLASLPITFDHRTSLKKLHYRRKLYVPRKGVERTDSGTAATSFNNSNVMLVTIAYIVKTWRKEFWEKDVEAVNKLIKKEIGFDLKIKIFEEPTLFTFLKGKFWLCADGEYRFGPLLSRIIKCSSSLRPVKDLVDEKYKHIAGECFLSAQALNLATMLQVPLVKEFVQRYAIYGSARVNLRNELSYNATNVRVANRNVALDRERMLIDIQTRYGLSEEELLVMQENILLSCCYCVIPGSFYKLLVDYE